MAKKKPNRTNDTSMAALTLHRDYPVFNVERTYTEQFTQVIGNDKEDGKYEILMVEGSRSLDGKDLSIFHHILTALKHTLKGKPTKGSHTVRISLKKLCDLRGIEYREQNIKTIEDSINSIENTKLTFYFTTQKKALEIADKSGMVLDEVIKQTKKIKHYVRVPLIQRTVRNGDIISLDIPDEYINSMVKKVLFFESVEMQKLSSVGTIAYETLQMMVGGVDNANGVKNRSFREAEFNKRLGWDKWSEATLRIYWSRLNKEWQERTSLPEFKRKTIDGVKWRVPKERKFDVFNDK